MDKLITFCVPCYNSAAYMDHCISTLLEGGDDIEIILVDDGSTKDDTPAICDRYQEKYPDIVRVIHQPNGGHGEGVNQGVRHATGIYYKVVDSDDWLDVPSLHKVLDKLRQFVRDEKLVDMMICNYVYEHAEDHTRKVPPLPVSPDALCHLPDGGAAPVRHGAAEALLLCGQYLRLPAPALCEEHVLHGH